MAEALLFSLELALGIVVPYLIVRRDLRRLDPEREGRAWTEASMWSAIVLFGPLSLPFHFVKTRRSFRGFLLGLVWMIAAFAAIAAVSTVLGLLLDAGKG